MYNVDDGLHASDILALWRLVQKGCSPPYLQTRFFTISNFQFLNCQDFYWVSLAHGVCAESSKAFVSSKQLHVNKLSPQNFTTVVMKVFSISFYKFSGASRSDVKNGFCYAGNQWYKIPHGNVDLLHGMATSSSCCFF